MKRPKAKERILSTASQLFYEQGFQATGINQIIEEAGIAKASLYQHYKSKDALLLAYLTISDTDWFESFTASLPLNADGRTVILHLFDFRKKNALAGHIKGCAFIRVAYELPSLSTNAIKIIQTHKLKLKDLIKTAVKTLKSKSPKQSDDLAELIYNLFEGCGIQSTILHSVEPITTAKKLAQKLLD